MLIMFVLILYVSLLIMLVYGISCPFTRSHNPTWRDPKSKSTLRSTDRDHLTLLEGIRCVADLVSFHLLTLIRCSDKVFNGRCVSRLGLHLLVAYGRSTSPHVEGYSGPGMASAGAASVGQRGGLTRCVDCIGLYWTT